MWSERYWRQRELLTHTTLTYLLLYFQKKILSHILESKLRACYSHHERYSTIAFICKVERQKSTSSEKLSFKYTTHSRGPLLSIENSDNYVKNNLNDYFNFNFKQSLPENENKKHWNTFDFFRAFHITKYLSW